MRAGLIALCLSYVLSQFYRAFLAVLGSALERDIGTSPEDLATASGLWFLAFAGAQLPLGWALDRVGPRRTASLVLLVGGAGGALVFAGAQGVAQVHLSMLLIGAGCAPLLVSAFYLLARQGDPAQFATTAALVLGIGSVGNIGASWPMAFAVEMMGWRTSMLVLAGITAFAAAALYAILRDPPPAVSDTRGSVLDLLKMPALWPIIPLLLVCYAPAAAVRGLWIGPYLSDMFGLSTGQLGQASLVMGAAMICGTLTYGPLDRVFGSHKAVCLVGNLFCGASALALAALVGLGAWTGIALCAAIGFFGGSFPVLIAHARAFFPPQLAGRGVTLMNLFGIGGVGLMQLISGGLQAEVAQASGAAVSYSALFALFGAASLLGCAFYAFSRDAPR